MERSQKKIIAGYNEQLLYLKGLRQIAAYEIMN